MTNSEWQDTKYVYVVWRGFAYAAPAGQDRWTVDLRRARTWTRRLYALRYAARYPGAEVVLVQVHATWIIPTHSLEASVSA